MNIEFEVKKILSSGLSINNKISVICNITNFRKEHINLAITTRFENDHDKFSQIYAELVRLDRYGTEKNKI